MRHLTEEALVLHYYREAPEGQEVESHLANCQACAQAYRELTRVLETVRALPVPEPREAFEAQIWTGVTGRLDTKLPQRVTRLQPRGARNVGPVRRWAPALAAAAALVIVAFTAGRFWERTTAPTAPATTTTQASHGPERILLVAVGDHLDRSQMLLLELTNASADVSAERTRAEDLLEANRLYRLSAAKTGEAAVTQVLDELERLLLDLARGPETLQASDLNSLQERIEARGLLFKVRVLASRVRDRERDLLRRVSAANTRS